MAALRGNQLHTFCYTHSHCSDASDLGIAQYNAFVLEIIPQPVGLYQSLRGDSVAKQCLQWQLCLVLFATSR
eukprot:5987122-Amphidinium_carterae.1